MAEARKIATEMLLDGVDGEYIYNISLTSSNEILRELGASVAATTQMGLSMKRRASKSTNGNHVMHLNLKMNRVGLLVRMEGGWFNFAKS